jgi:chromosomal replication initiator protein
MAHDVNRGESDVAAQVRRALVENISSERVDLWIPEDTEWEWLGSALRLRFTSDFTCQLAKKMLLSDVSRSVRAVTQQETEVLFETRLEDNADHASPTGISAVPERGSAGRLRQSNGNDSSGSPRRTATVARGLTQPPLVDSPEVDSPELSFDKQDSTDELRAPDRRVMASGSPRRPAAVEESRPNPGQSMAEQSRGGPRDAWDAYLSGNSNRLAWATANMIIGEPGKLSPVLFHGPCGCGKSMLITGIVQRMRSQRRMLRVVHMTSEQFTNDFTEGLRGGGLPMFRRKYRDVEALVLDDIQFFAGKKSTIAELKHTIDNLLRLGKQVVLTSDRPLGDLHFLGNELVGRLRGGLVSPLFPLDQELRGQLLRQRIQQAELTVSSSVIDQLAARASGDGRVVSGIVNRLIAVAAVHNDKLEWENCWDAVCDLIQATQPVVRLGDIERAVCSMFGLETQSLQTSSKHRSVTQPRMLAMFLARKYTPAAYHEIGQYFGKRKHSTVISAEKTVSSWLSDNPNHQLTRGVTVRDAIRQVEAQLQVG